MLAGFVFLLLITGVVPLNLTDEERNCSYSDVLMHLNLTKNKELFAMTRPVRDYKQPTVVTLDVLLYAILDVREKNQELVPHLWLDIWWQNDFISWEPEEFCGISSFSLPTEMLWKPDITIKELTESDKSPKSPYLTVEHNGEITLTNDQVLVSTCRMQVHKFPFDIQSCNLTFKSIIYNADELKLVQNADSRKITEWTRKLMQTQYEWLFINMSVHNMTINNFDFMQSVLIYTIFIRRRSALYIVNFMLPVLFFLCLDLSSFLISDSAGEKLGFKITVLLAVTVLQLILNEILPASSNRIPLIAVYCIGIFGLMMLSLLETILVMYLMGKDFKNNKADEEQKPGEDCESKKDKVSFHSSCRDINKLITCASTEDLTPGEKLSEVLSVANEGSSIQLTEESRDLEKVLEELKEVLKLLSVQLSSKKEEIRQPGYWKRITRIINKVFFVFYVIAAAMFLVRMFFSWDITYE